MPAHAIPYWRLSSIYFFYCAVLGAWIPFWPLYLQSLGYGAAAIGVLIGVMQATRIVAPNLWGWLADRSGARMRIIRIGTVLSLLFFSGVFWRKDFFALALIIAAYSFFSNAVLPQLEVVTLTYLGGAYQRYGRVRVWGSIGFIGVVTALGFLFDRVALQWLPFVLAALWVCVWLSTLTVREPARPLLPEHAVRGSLRAIVRQPVAIAFFVSCFLLQVAHGPYYTFFSVYLESKGYPRAHTGLLWSLGVIAEVILFIYMHRVFAFFSLRSILLASLAIAVLRWLLIAFCVQWLPVLLFAQCLHAATYASYHAVAVELVRRLFAGGHEGQGMAMYSGFCYGGGSAVGAVLSGLLWDVSPTATFVFAALVSLLSLLIAWRWIDPPPTPIAADC